MAMDPAEEYYWRVFHPAPVPSVYHSGIDSSQYHLPPANLPVGTQLQREPDSDNYSYSVKIINPSDFVVRKWHDVTEVFQTPVELKVELCESFPDDTSTGNNMKMGYFQGHQKCWIFDYQDLRVMYQSFKPGSLITLWFDKISDGIPTQRS